METRFRSSRPRGTLRSLMAGDAPSTIEHRGPSQPRAGVRRPALVCAFPRPGAVALPDSGSIVGRDWLARHGLADTEVSSSHLKVSRAGGVLRVADAGSRNGTYVNGVRLASGDLTPLENGATLRLGRTIFVFARSSAAPSIPHRRSAISSDLTAYGEVADTIAALARSRPGNVLVEGETGTGKELVAGAVATALGRATKLAAVNVAGVARGVFESQMFGHVAGAFSDAKTAAPGIVVAHDGGTLFLDEIGELGLELQVKLLRLLENREVLAVGAHRPTKVDILVVAATNRNLEEMVERGEFRRDLFARLAMARIRIPALRDRNEDIFSIAEALGARAGAASALTHDAVEVEAVERLLHEPWPGNVRELAATLAAVGRLDPEPGLRLWALDEALGEPRAQRSTALTQEAVDQAIEAAGGNVTAAAEKLGVSRGKLLRILKRTKSP